MIFTESRMRSGPGILILQHKDYSKDLGKQNLDVRSCMLAVRITGRKEGVDELGHYKAETNDVGDITNCLLWPKASRPISGWSWAWASVTQSPSNRTVQTPGGGDSNVIPLIPPGGKGSAANTRPIGASSGCGVADPGISMRPVKNLIYDPDDRFSTLRSFPPFAQTGQRMWPKFPLKYYGITVTTTNEDKQEELFMPTDPRLVAVNFGGDPAMGSFICDLSSDFNFDPTRIGKLQSLAWVVKLPVGCSPTYFPVGANMVAWNIGFSGCGDVRGGAVVDAGETGSTNSSTAGTGPSSGGTYALPRGDSTIATPNLDLHGKRVIGMASRFLFGPFDVGSESPLEKHFIGQDADGNQINSLHIPTIAYFREPGSLRRDAPLHFEKDIQVKIQPGDFRTPVHLEYWEKDEGIAGNDIFHESACGKRKGQWRWSAESIFVVVEEKEKKKKYPPDPVDTTKKPPPVDTTTRPPVVEKGQERTTFTSKDVSKKITFTPPSGPGPYPPPESGKLPYPPTTFSLDNPHLTLSVSPENMNGTYPYRNVASMNVCGINTAPTGPSTPYVTEYRTFLAQFSAAGGSGTYTYSSIGTLPPGLTLTASGVNAGKLSGTPYFGPVQPEELAAVTTTYSFTIKATDGKLSGSKSFSITFRPALQLLASGTLVADSCNMASCHQFIPYTYTPYSAAHYVGTPVIIHNPDFSDMPSGLAGAQAGLDWVISGTPSGGPFGFRFENLILTDDSFDPAFTPSVSMTATTTPIFYFMV